MTHMDAETTQAVDRYLLKQMSEAETQAFELHYFECPECAAEVEAGTLFKEAVKALPRAEDHPAPAPWWRQWRFATPAFAALVLAAVSFYQQTELAALRAPQGMLAFTVKSEQRAEATAIPITLPAGTQRFEINLDVPTEAAGFPSYHCELSGPSSSAFNSPLAGDQLHLSIPIAGLRPGVYTLKVRGVRDAATGPEISYSFQLQLP